MTHAFLAQRITLQCTSSKRGLPHFLRIGNCLSHSHCSLFLDFFWAVISIFSSQVPESPRPFKLLQVSLWLAQDHPMSALRRRRKDSNPNTKDQLTTVGSNPNPKNQITTRKLTKDYMFLQTMCIIQFELSSLTKNTGQLKPTPATLHEGNQAKNGEGSQIRSIPSVTSSKRLELYL